MGQEFLNDLRSNPRDFHQLGFQMPLRPAVAMKRYGEPVTLIANLLDQAQYRRPSFQNDGIVFPAGDINDLLTLGNTGQWLIDDVQIVQCRPSRVKLPNSAV